MQTIGILGLQGDIEEHMEITRKAAGELGREIQVARVRTPEQIRDCSGLIIPGGESTTLSRLMDLYGLWDAVKSVPNIMGTCAGAIMLAKEISGKKEWQKSLGLMDIAVARNAYGSQLDSFSEKIGIELGGTTENINATFIRAPVIEKVFGKARVIAELEERIIAAEQKEKENYYLALTFHPELDTTLVHQQFIERTL